MFFKKRVKIPLELNNLINDFQTHEIEYSNRIDIDNNNYYVSDMCEKKIISEIKEIKMTETFQKLLFNYIDRTGLSDSEIYNKAHIDRRLFSKIRSDINYHPSFGTITQLALALELSTKDYEKLLKSASYSLEINNIQQIVIKYCFDHKIYDVIYVNNLLYTITNKEIKNL